MWAWINNLRDSRKRRIVPRRISSTLNSKHVPALCDWLRVLRFVVLFLLFAGRALGRPEYIELWKKLPGDSTVDEVVRNFFVRQPVLWLD